MISRECLPQDNLIEGYIEVAWAVDLGADEPLKLGRKLCRDAKEAQCCIG